MKRTPVRPDHFRAAARLQLFHVTDEKPAFDACWDQLEAAGECHQAISVLGLFTRSYANAAGQSAAAFAVDLAIAAENPDVLAAALDTSLLLGGKIGLARVPDGRLWLVALVLCCLTENIAGEEDLTGHLEESLADPGWPAGVPADGVWA